MKHMKRYLSILSAVCLPAVISASAYTGRVVPPEGRVPFEAESSASGSAYDSMIKSFYEDQPESRKSMDDVYTVSGITADGFPDAYAGAYINENMDLVVLMTESAAAANSEDLIFSTAKYSYSELVSIMDDILQYLKRSQANADDGFLIVSYCIDDQNNRVIVGLSDISDACIASFKEKVCDSPAVSFELEDTSEQMDYGSPGRHFQALE